jgi:hypothetical protein
MAANMRRARYKVQLRDEKGFTDIVSVWAEGESDARPPSEPLRRAAWVMLIAGPLVAGVLTMLLQLACPAARIDMEDAWW